MQLLSRHLASFVVQRQRAGRIAEELDFEPPMDRFASGGVAAHVGHVACDGDGIDALLLQEFLQRRIGEAAG